MKKKKPSEMNDEELWSRSASDSAWNNPKDEAASKFYIERYLKKRKAKRRKS
ncbi:MAG: hypothetical protein NTV88_02660 [Candidatus Micrarchaeota archaeon]|nr:hypothetical protein [Candidatus Micrarchaeota archaeon]